MDTQKLFYYTLLYATFWLLPILGMAQSGTITGKVVRNGTGTPIERASVFLNNATYGTSTAEDGTFTLRGVKPGQYSLIVSSVGYELYSQTVLVGISPVNVDVRLTPKTTELRDVVITTPEGWKRNYEMFVNDFIGDSEDAKKCKILNPRDLYLVWHKGTRTLEASSDEFIVIENYALGYRVKLLLHKFESNKTNNTISWQLNQVFEDLPGSESQKRRWTKRRDEIFYGSTAHFFRSLVGNQLDENGFVIRTLIRRPNKLRAPDAVIEKKREHFKNGNQDSLNYWIRQHNLSRYDDSLVRKPMAAYDVLRRTDQPGIYAVMFKDLLYVVYNRRYETIDFRDIYHPLDLPNFETTVINLYQPYAVFDLNGTVLNGGSMLFDGSWSKNKGAELLPVDYTPVNPPPLPPQ